MVEMTFQTGNIQGTYSWEGSTLKIHLLGSGSMRSPDGRKDWLTNLFYVPVAGVHSGYLFAAYRVAVKLSEQIDLATKVVITGHSLGGAVAEVLAAGVKHKRAEAHNYGGPRPWRRRITAWWATSRADITWYSRGWDIVPWIPPWYHHAGKHVHLGKGLGNFINTHINGCETRQHE
jgi:hypothetical protein